jgi:DNA-binding beta-propeller fold protein YncE
VCARRVVVRVVCPLLVVVGLGVVPSVAVGARAHGFSSAFGGSGVGAGLLLLAAPNVGGDPGSGTAVDGVSGDVFVADTGNRRVDEFSAAGVFVRAWGWGVATGASELQVCVASCLRGLSGSAPGEFEVPVEIAVDNDLSSASHGDVYVGDVGDGLVSKFTETGELVKTWGNALNVKHEPEPNGRLGGSPTELFNLGFAGLPLAGITVDSSGNLWVFNANSRMFEFTEAGVWLMTCEAHLGSGAKAVAMTVNGEGDLFVVDGAGKVRRVEPGCGGGSKQGVLTSGVQEATGLAVDLFDGALYVDEGGGLIEAIPAACTVSEGPCAAGQVFGEGRLGGAAGLAVAPVEGLVYAASTLTDQVVVFDTVVEAKSLAAGEVLAHSAVLHGEVNPDGGELSRCSYEYGETESYGLSVPCAESLSLIGKAHGLVAVHAKVEGLTGGTAYHFRVRATNTNGDVRSEDTTLKTLQTARVEEPTTSEVGPVSAVVSARVNAEGVAGPAGAPDSVCEIEYATAGEYEAAKAYAKTLACEPAGVTGSAPVAVTGRLEGLSEGTTYHWRVQVEDENGVTDSTDSTFVYLPKAPVLSGCPNEALRVENNSTGLPDCRGYEMVTPAFKNGALVDNGFFISLPAFAENGDSVITPSIQCFAGPASCVGSRESEGEPLAFTRTATGWVTGQLAPPASFPGNTIFGYSADTGLVLYILPAAGATPEALYAREPDGTLKEVGPLAETGHGDFGSIAASTHVITNDLSHVLYESKVPLWPSFDEGHGPSVYEYAGAGGAPELVGVSGGAGSRNLISACGTAIAGFEALSVDGRAVFFTAKPCLTGTGVNVGVKVAAQELYARFDGARTEWVSAPAPEPECDKACQSQPAGDASFEVASVDGSRVLFTSTQQLTDSASEDNRAGDSAFTTGCANTAAGSTGCNLYQFECPRDCEEPAARRLVDISAGDSSGVGPQVQGVMAASADGSHVYFVARGVLTHTKNVAGREPVEGHENLYVYEQDEGHPAGQITFIATLSPTDQRQWAGGKRGGVANVTSDGGFLVFTSHAGLTADAIRGEGPAQVYRYDAKTGVLVRVSVGEKGFNDNGNGVCPSKVVCDARIVPSDDAFLNRNGLGRASPSVSGDGGMVFFQSPVGLTVGALGDRPVTGNLGVLAQNVYEWEASGTRLPDGQVGCEEAAGCVSLVSDGRDLAEGSDAHENESAVELLGVDSTGENVFFTTADQLVASDTDSQVDYYDARIEGGFPASQPLPSCEVGDVLVGEECRSTQTAPSVFGGLASATFSGLGNSSESVHVPVVLTPAQILAGALKACHRKPAGRKRAACEATAHQRYRTELLAAALKACRTKPPGKARAGCETQAHKHYARHARHAGRRASGGVRR